MSGMERAGSLIAEVLFYIIGKSMKKTDRTKRQGKRGKMKEWRKDATGRPKLAKRNRNNIR